METSDTTPESWEFAGWGTAEKIANLETSPDLPFTRLDQAKRHLLGRWRATAICGNDITSSVLYVSALCAAQAGALAPLVLLMVAGVLFLYRKVYAEVGSALPLNGGTYTVLLNTTNKRIAAGAAVLTLLSYIATAVISANEAIHYATNLIPVLPVIAATVGLLGIFALLNILGVTESAAVALVIFIVHIGTLVVLSVTCGIAFDPSLFAINWEMPDPRGLGVAIFFGFAAGMLGISGFESSANFIEEQERGVFPITLRNMWIAIAIFNPLISLLSLGLLPLEEIRNVPPDMLADMGGLAAGPALAWWVSLDAVLVLSGAVLTSFVGVTGLVRRMALDRSLPQFLLHENRWRNTNHRIIIGFFLLCTSILLITEGDIGKLAGVYTLSFLSVMALFAIGNMLLKHKRSRLPRDVRAGWLAVSVALVAVLAGLLGNVLLNPTNVEIFATYFFFAGLAVGSMFLRREILRVFLNITGAMVERVRRVNEAMRERIIGRINEINRLAVVYFTRGDDPAILNRAALYVLTNEQTNHMKVVHVYEREQDIPPHLAEQLSAIDHLYPGLRIDFIAVKGTFGPALIDRLARRLRVPKNLMFIGTPGDRFPHRIEELGGVRVIL